MSIASRRRALGLSQAALARLCGPGVSATAICELEHGRPEVYPTAARLVPAKLAELEARKVAEVEAGLGERAPLKLVLSPVTCPSCGGLRTKLTVHEADCRAASGCPCARWDWICVACIERHPPQGEGRERPPFLMHEWTEAARERSYQQEAVAWAERLQQGRLP